MSRLTRWLDRVAYRSYADNWDNRLFREAVIERLPSTGNVLDLGAGAGIVREMDLRGLGLRIHGIDLDPRVLHNPLLDDARVGSAEDIPYADGSFELVVCNNVLEHLPDPGRAFREVARVLRPGGAFLAKTPNRWHYVTLIARMTPHRAHEVVNAWRGRDREDTFPTLYRANSSSALRRWAATANLAVERVRYVEGRPEYLRILAPAYLLGIAYERIVNATERLAPLRVVLIATLRKPGGS
jgi:SAM-dependent methyltransferase